MLAVEGYPVIEFSWTPCGAEVFEEPVIPSKRSGQSSAGNVGVGQVEAVHDVVSEDV